MHYRRGFPPIMACILLAALVLSLACKTASYTADQVFPTRTSNPTYTPVPTYTPAPTYTLSPAWAPNPTYTPYPTLTPPPSLTPSPTPVSMLMEDFESGTPSFAAEPVGFYDNRSSGSGQVVGGEYRLKITPTKSDLYIATTNLDHTRDFTMQVDVKPIRGPEFYIFGLTFGLGPGTVAYLLSSDGGYCATYITTEDISKQKDSRLAGCWAKLPISINADGFNTLKVLARGGQFDLFINDKFLATLVRPGFSTAGGLFGLAVGAVKSSSAIEVAFDNLLITQP
jgi:hypothetical protein